MEGTLKFNLPEEQSMFDVALNGTKWRHISWEMDKQLRQYLKYGHEFQSVDEALQTMRDSLYELLEDEGVNFE